MKKKLLLVCFLFLTIITSCNKSEGIFDEIEPSLNDPLLKENLKGETGAIRAVEDFMSSIKNASNTRSTIVTSVGAISKKSISEYSQNNNLATRSATNNEMAIYEIILENSDNTQGFAIVADENSPTLLAFSEVGNIADTVFNQGLAFWFREMANALTVDHTITTRSFNLFEDTWSDGAYYTDIPGTKEFYRNIAVVSLTPKDDLYMSPDWYPSTMLTQTKIIPTKTWVEGVPIAWLQDYPYNMMISARKPDGSNANVGCFGIAAATIICYHRYLPGYDWIDWAKLQQYRYLDGTNPPMELIIQGALLCKAIAEDSGATWWHNGTGSTDAAGVRNAFRNVFNYNITESYGLDRNLIKNEMAAGRPMMIGANNTNTSYDYWAGHIWVIDGYYIGTKYHYFTERTKISGLFPKYSYDDYRCKAQIDMLHMIWGWRGSNGWYATFKPENNPPYNLNGNIYLYSGIYPKS